MPRYMRAHPTKAAAVTVQPHATTCAKRLGVIKWMSNAIVPYSAMVAATWPDGKLPVLGTDPR